MAIRLRVCLDRAWARMMAMPPMEIASFGTRTKANIVHDFWTEEVQADFAGDHWTQFVEDQGLKQLVNEFVRIRFKKMNRARLVAGNRTRQSASWIQLPIPGITRLLSLNFGYRPDPLWSKIELAGLALQVGNSVPWFLEVGPPTDAEEVAFDELPSLVKDRRIRVKRHVVETRQANLLEESDESTSQTNGA